jgi:hypothetical protein
VSDFCDFSIEYDPFCDIHVGQSEIPFILWPVQMFLMYQFYDETLHETFKCISLLQIKFRVRGLKKLRVDWNWKMLINTVAAILVMWKK